MLLFHLCLSDLFLTQARQREKEKKNLGKSRWAKSVVTYESAEICGSRCQGKICHISPNLREKIRREAEDRGRRAVEVCQG